MYLNHFALNSNLALSHTIYMYTHHMLWKLHVWHGVGAAYLVVREVLWRWHWREEEARRNVHGSGRNGGIPVRTNVAQVVM